MATLKELIKKDPTIKSLTTAFDPKEMKKKAVEGAFSGEGILSAYIRGQLGVKGKKGATAEKTSSGVASPEFTSNLKSIADSAMSLPVIARYMKVLALNMIKLAVAGKGGKKGRQSKQREEGTVQAEYKKDMDFFKAQDAEEAKIEAERAKSKTSPTQEGTKPEKPKEEGGILDTILQFFKGGILNAIKEIFNPANLLSIFKKVFIIATIFASLFEGITAAFNKFKETGSIKDAIIAGLGAILDFLTFGLFGEDNVKKMFKAVEDFINPIIQSISETITAIKDWVANNIGIPRIGFKVLGKEMAIGPWYPFKADPTSVEPQKTQTPVVADVKGDSSTPAAAGIESEPGSMSDYSAGAKALQEKYGNVSANESSPTFELPKNAAEAQKLIVEQASKVLGMPLPDPEKMAKDGTTGSPELDRTIQEQIESVIKEKKLEPQSTTGGGTGGTVSAAGGGGGGGEVSAAGGGSGSESITPSPAGAEPSMSGEQIAGASTDIAEQQRMESAADVGNQMNNSSVTNNSGSEGKEPKPQIADVYDTEFAKLLAA
jgi:hypothetical protein